MFGLLAGLHASFTFRRSFDTEKTNFENNFMVKERNMFIDSGSGFYSVENSFFTRRNKGRKFEVYQAQGMVPFEKNLLRIPRIPSVNH